MAKGHTSLDKTSVIYAIRCKENGKIYIAVTQDVEKSVEAFFYELKRGRKKAHVGRCRYENLAIQDDYNLYSREAFELYILEEDVPWDIRDARKSFWIKEYKTFDEDFGYNTGTPRPRDEIKISCGLPPKLSND